MALGIDRNLITSFRQMVQLWLPRNASPSGSDIIPFINSTTGQVQTASLTDLPLPSSTDPNGIYYSEDYADLDTAISTIGATPGTLIIHDAISAVNNVTVPTTLAVVFTGGGMLTVPTTKTVTFNGPFDAMAWMRTCPRCRRLLEKTDPDESWYCGHCHWTAGDDVSRRQPKGAEDPKP